MVCNAHCIYLKGDDNLAIPLLITFLISFNNFLSKDAIDILIISLYI